MAVIVPPSLPVQLLQERDALDLLVIGTIFASFLIPVSVILFVFTSVRTWRTPLFVLNVLAIILGLVHQVLYTCVITNTMLLRAVPSAMIVSLVAFDFLVPVCVQGIPIIRLVEAYPPSRHCRMVNMAIYIPIVALKIVCVVNAGYGTYAIASRTTDSLDAITAAWVLWDTTYVKIQWLLQIFDDMFVFGLLAHKFYRSAVARNHHDVNTVSTSAYSWALRFPTMFNIAKLIIMFCDPSFFHSAIVITVNCYLTITTVLFATIWGYDALVPPVEQPRTCTTTAMSTLQSASRQMSPTADTLCVSEEENESMPST